MNEWMDGWRDGMGCDGMEGGLMGEWMNGYDTTRDTMRCDAMDG